MTKQGPTILLIVKGPHFSIYKLSILN